MKRYKSLFPAVALVVALVGWACGGADTITGVDYQTDALVGQVAEERAGCPEGWEDDPRYPAAYKPCVGR